MHVLCFAFIFGGLQPYQRRYCLPQKHLKLCNRRCVHKQAEEQTLTIFILDFWSQHTFPIQPCLAGKISPVPQRLILSCSSAAFLVQFDSNKHKQTNKQTNKHRDRAGVTTVRPITSSVAFEGSRDQSAIEGLPVYQCGCQHSIQSKRVQMKEANCTCVDPFTFTPAESHMCTSAQLFSAAPALTATQPPRACCSG